MAKKVKKSGSEGINSRLQLVMKSGKVSLGCKTAINALRTGKGQPFFLSRPVTDALTRRCGTVGAAGVVLCSGRLHTRSSADFSMFLCCGRREPISSVSCVG